jgi:hypothetical protein
MTTKVELLEHLRKLSGMPPLNEEELSILAEGDDAEILEEKPSKKELLARFGDKMAPKFGKGGKKEESKHDDDDVEDEEGADDDVEEEKGSKKDSKKVEEAGKPSKEELLARFGKKKAKPFKKGGGRKEEDEEETDEALTDTKKKGNQKAGADAKVVQGDPGLDPEADKHAPASDAGEEEVLEGQFREFMTQKLKEKGISMSKLSKEERTKVFASMKASFSRTKKVDEADAVQKTTADGGIPKGKQKVGDKSDEKNITPEKKKGAKAVGADMKVVMAEEMIPGEAMTQIVKEAMDNAQGDEDQKLAEVGRVFNRMMAESFNSAQNRREELRDLVNRSEVSKKMMVHEVNGTSVFGEGMQLKEAAGLYESDKQNLKQETSQRLLSQFKVQNEDEEVDDNYVAEQMMIDRLIGAEKKSLNEASLAKATVGRARLELVTAVVGKAQNSATVKINGEKHNVSEGKKKGVFDGVGDVSWRQELDPKTVRGVDKWLAKEIPANADKSK